MKTNQLTTKESVYLTYAYVSISAFVLMVVNSIIGNLEKAIEFNPIVSLAIILNMVTLISFHYYKKKHSA
jgi:hypothetical protein